MREQVRLWPAEISPPRAAWQRATTSTSMLSRYSPPFFRRDLSSAAFFSLSSSPLPTPNRRDQKPRFFFGASSGGAWASGCEPAVAAGGAGGGPTPSDRGGAGFSGRAPKRPATPVVLPRVP